MRALIFAVAVGLIALPTMAHPDPAEQAVVGSVQVLINQYEAQSRELAAANKALSCWEKTGRACEPTKPRHATVPSDTPKPKEIAR